MTADFREQGGGIEGHRLDVVGLSVSDPVGLHRSDLQHGTDGILHVHHGQYGVLPEETGVGLGSMQVVEHLDGVIGGAPARWAELPNEPGVPDGSRVHAMVLPEPGAPLFTGLLADSVDGLGQTVPILLGDGSIVGPEDRN